MNKHLLTLALTAFSLPAFANLEIAGIAQATQTKYESSGNNSYATSNGSKLGVLLLFPIFPGLSIRTGYIQNSRTMNATVKTSGVAYDSSEKINEIPVNLQLGLPITDLYLFGGAIIASTQSSSCAVGTNGCSSSNTPSDTSVNVGIGYDLVSVALFRVALELEAQRGTKNLDLGSGDVKQTQMSLGLVAAFGF